MIREELAKKITEAIAQKFEGHDTLGFSMEPSVHPEHGDYASNVALLLGKNLSRSPLDVAHILAEELSKNTEIFAKVETAAPGFINFYLSPDILFTEFKNILREENKYGGSDKNSGKKARVEYVSANPTGPLHIGNARGGPLGESICRVLEKTGYKVLREYYHNDTGTQVEKMGDTLWYWYQKLLGLETEFPEGGYLGEYLREVAETAVSQLGKDLKKGDLERLTRFGLEQIFKENSDTLNRLRIKFDSVVKESELLSSGKTAKIVEELKKKGVAKEKEGAIWFSPKTGILEDDQDSVLIRSTGQPTYFASDAAYHKEKFSSGYDLVVDILGSNHHGHVPRLKALAEVFEFDPAKFLAVLYQYVRVKKDGVAVKMSKRAGTYVTAKEILDEVGADSVTFFFLMNNTDSHMDFDLNLAREQSQKNPVFYVQYAHARISSILQKATFQGFAEENLKLLDKEEELQLIKHLLKFPEVVDDTARDFQVQRLPRHALEIARAFHNFYEKHRVITDNPDLSEARLMLVSATQIILKNLFQLMNISLPEKM